VSLLCLVITLILMNWLWQFLAEVLFS